MEKIIAARKILIVGAGLAAAYGVMKVIAKKSTEQESLNDNNPYIHTSDCVYFEYSESSTLSPVERKITIYEKAIKPVLDQILSFTGLIVLSPIYAGIAIAIKIDDPGPVFFTQKRVGKDGYYFFCHKFRSMKVNTPHDIPTHRLAAPEQYITRVGRVLRTTSLDELPQIWDIFRSKMSLIGPRPALWNQHDLIQLRAGSGCDGISANSVKPGLTGVAQIKGRDELELDVKAFYDREYVSVLRSGSLKGLAMDIRYFFRTIKSVLKHDGVIEGGTGSNNFCEKC